MEVAIVNFDAVIGLYQDTSVFFKRVFESGNNVTHLGCNKGLTRCTNFLSHGNRIDETWLLKNRESICLRCRKEQARLADKGSIFLDPELDGLNVTQRQIIADLASIKSAAASLFLSVEYDGAALGLKAFFDFSMFNKLSHRSQLNSDQIADFLEHLKDAFFVWNFIDRSLRTKRFDAAIYVNGNYSLNAVARERLNRSGVKCWSIEYSWANSVIEKRVYLERDRLEHRRDWSRLEAVKAKYQCSLSDGLTAIDGFRSRVQGVDANSYSSRARTESWDRFDQFRQRFKELVSIFVSSGDELLTHEVVYGFVQDTRYFKDQSEWLRFLISNANPEVGYVVRLHPRLKPNKRDSVQAEEYVRLADALAAAHGMNNFLILEADESISSYYVLLHSALSVVSWSMMALESVVLGIPTIACFPKNMSFPIEKMGPEPESVAEIRSYVRREQIPLRTLAHEVEMVTWISIIFSGIGMKIPGVRHARNLPVRLWAKIHQVLLSSRLLFSVFFGAAFNKKVITSPDGAIDLVLDEVALAKDRTPECLQALQNFRREVRISFGISEMKSSCGDQDQPGGLS